MATHEATVEGVGVGVGDEGRGNPVVLLRAREELMPIFVSADQAQSMQHALDGTPFERVRPGIHRERRFDRARRSI